MDRTQLFQHFEALADTPEAREKIQQLVLDFAVRGRLAKQNSNEEAFDLEAAQSGNDPDLKAPPPEEQPFTVPQNWIWGRFGQVFNIEGGTQPPKDQFVASPRNGYIRLLQIRDFGHRPVPTYIPKTDKLRVCATNDVMLARYGASVGKVLMGHEGAYNVALTRVVFNHSRLDARFVFWWLQTSQFQKVLTGMSRSAQAGFNKGDLFPVPLPFPPLAEQRRIVAKVEELLALCDELDARQTAAREHRTRLVRSALDHLTTAQDESDFKKHSAFCLQHSELLFDSVPALRQAILALAVQGKLVPQDPNDEPTETILKRITKERRDKSERGSADMAEPLMPVEEREKPFPLPFSWQWVRLGDIASIKHGFAFSSESFTSEPTPFVLMTPGNFHEKGGFRDRGSKTKYYDGTVDPGFIFKSGDLIIPMTEQAAGLLGSPAFIPDDGKSYLHNQRLGKLSFYSESIAPEFVFSFFNCAFFRACHEHLAKSDLSMSMAKASQ